MQVVSLAKINIVGVEVAHIASLLSENAKVIVYGVLPMQMDSLTKDLQAQNINSILILTLRENYSRTTAKCMT